MIITSGNISRRTTPLSLITPKPLGKFCTVVVVVVNNRSPLALMQSRDIIPRVLVRKLERVETEMKYERPLRARTEEIGIVFGKS